MKPILRFLAALTIVPCSFVPAFADGQAALASCRAASKRGDLENAIEHCSAALKGDSGGARAEVLDLRASAYLGKEQYDLAIRDYGEVIRRDPGYPNAYINRGIAYRAKGDIDAAIRDYTQAITINQGIALAYNNRGNAYRAKGEYDLAIKDFDLAIKLDPTDARHFNNRAGAYGEKGNSENAIADFTRAIELDPDFAVAYMDRASLLNKRGDFDEGLADADRGVALEPDDHLGWWTKAVAEFGLARHAAAVETLDHLQQMRPRDPWVALLHYLARERAGRNGTEALKAFAAEADLARWPGTVIRFYLGNASTADVEQGATDADSRCDAAFYLGQHNLLKGDRGTARSLLQEAAKTCSAALYERAWATAELNSF